LSVFTYISDTGNSVMSSLVFVICWACRTVQCISHDHRDIAHVWFLM